jgi:hypothetical protein
VIFPSGALILKAVLQGKRKKNISGNLTIFGKVDTNVNQEEKLDWTEAFNWLKSNSVGTELTASTTEEKPKIVDEFFNYICK